MNLVIFKCESSQAERTISGAYDQRTTQKGVRKMPSSKLLATQNINSPFSLFNKYKMASKITYYRFKLVRFIATVQRRFLRKRSPRSLSLRVTVNGARPPRRVNNEIPAQSFVAKICWTIWFKRPYQLQVQSELMTFVILRRSLAILE